MQKSTKNIIITKNAKKYQKRKKKCKKKSKLPKIQTMHTKNY